MNKYEEKDAVYYLNSIITQGFSYKKIQKECSKKPVPDERSFKEHQQKCLKDFVVKKLDINENDDTLDRKSSNKISPFAFKNHDDESGENRVVN